MISYTADTPTEYQSALRNIKTLQDLKTFGEHWHEMFPDAAAAILPMTDIEFVEFQKGERKERQEKYSGEAWAAKYGAILLPELMMRVGLIANHFRAPFGAAWNRCEDLGAIQHNDVCYFWRDPEPPSDALEVPDASA